MIYVIHELFDSDNETALSVCKTCSKYEIRFTFTDRAKLESHDLSADLEDAWEFANAIRRAVKAGRRAAMQGILDGDDEEET
jgi:hypothetical protein